LAEKKKTFAIKIVKSMRLISTSFILLFVASLSAQPDLVKNIYPNGESVPRNFYEYHGQLLFSAVSPDFGRELWISDGTNEGTVLLRDINGNPEVFGGNANPASLITYNGSVYFRADDGVHGQELWVTDGTSEGTQLLADIFPGEESSSPNDFVIFEDKLYFTADDGVHGQELWRTDGTAAGTFLVADISAGPDPSAPLFKAVANGRIYFSAGDGLANGVELWSSDGTAEGTQLVKDIDPDGNSFPFYFVEFGGEVFFVARTMESGSELWKTDGTADGTGMVTEINPAGSSGVTSLFVMGRYLFFQADDGEHGSELWVSDGTAAGTQLLADINPGAEGSFPFRFTPLLEAIEEACFVAATETQGAELWRLVVGGASNIDEIVVEQIQDINPGPASAEPRDLIFNGDALYFSAEDAQYGRELYKLPLSELTASRITDINIAGPSVFDEIKQAGELLFFAGTDGDSGDELWVLSVPLPELSIATNEGPLESGDTLDFGVLPVGEAVPAYLIMSNDGNANLIFGGGDFLEPSAPFDYYGPPLVSILPSGILEVLPYSFTPEAPGIYIDSVYLESNDLSRSPFLLYLHGRADIEGSVNALEKVHVEAYPNPVRSQLTLELGESFSNGQLSIYYQQGRLIFGEPIPDSARQLEILLSHLPAGAYFLELRDAKRRGTVELLKE